VVDGEIGLVGGINISDRYDNRLGNKVFWRDTHLKIVGLYYCPAFVLFSLSRWPPFTKGLS